MSTHALFTPLRIKNIEFRNRIAVSPMCQYSSIDGFANDWHLVHLGSRAVGGAGLIIFEATAISPEGRITPDDLGLWQDEHIPMLQKIVRFIKAQGSVAGIQLAHAGRKASTKSPWKGGTPLKTEEGAWQTLAPSAIPFRPGEPVPHAMSGADIEELIVRFRAAAQRALQAGFELIEIHAAHGYLLHEFLSPLSNQRTDDWGGSFENRCRLLLRVVKAVQEVWPQEYPLLVRISATDWTENGWSAEDSISLAALLKAAGVDLIDCSSGGNVPAANIPVGPNYQVQFAEQIKRETGILTGAVGMINTPQQAAAIIAEGQADLVILARAFLRDPYFPLHAAHSLGIEVPWPVQYERAKPRLGH